MIWPLPASLTSWSPTSLLPLYAGCPLSFLRSLTLSFFSNWALVSLLFLTYFIPVSEITNGLVDWSWRWCRSPFLLCLIVNIYKVLGRGPNTLYMLIYVIFMTKSLGPCLMLPASEWQQNFTQSLCFSSLTWTIAWKEYVIPLLHLLK